VDKVKNSVTRPSTHLKLVPPELVQFIPPFLLQQTSMTVGCSSTSGLVAVMSIDALRAKLFQHVLVIFNDHFNKQNPCSFVLALNVN